MLDRYRVKTELTSTPHSGMLRFTFPDSGTRRIKIDLTRRIGGDNAHSTAQWVRQVDDHTFEGWMKCDPSGGGWGWGAGKVSYTLYFSMQTNISVKRFGVWDGSHVSYDVKEQNGSQSGFFLEFPASQMQQTLVKCGISFVSVDGARANLAHDIPGWDFDAVRQASRRLWSQALGDVAIRGGSEAQKTIFYTALYHALLDPRTVTDVDGTYIAPDQQPRKIKSWTARTCFSGWDVYRAEFPLLDLIRPDIVNDEVNSLMQVNELGPTKGLPRWELMGRDTPIMLGDPALSVISDAYLKGIRGFDAHKAYTMCLQVAQGPEEKSNRIDLKHWLANGYCTGDTSISLTLESAYDDYALGRFAEAMGKTDDRQSLYKTALNYRNGFDKEVGWFRGRNENGGWQDWNGRLRSSGCIESNPEQQGWFVPQDVAGLIDLVGGKDEFNRQLNEFFENTSPDQIKGWNDWCNHSNEPVHQCAFLFAYSGEPWLTQKWSRFICDNAYGTGPNGLCGNDDVGQMSAWYVFAAAGLYPANPVSNVYIIGSPTFDKATFRVGAQHKQIFTIIANDNSASNIYIQSAKLNGKALQKAWLTYDEIARGATLELQMGPQPNKSWGSNPSLVPPSLSESK
jgi:predicted alpha-1,2-mannosidase